MNARRLSPGQRCRVRLGRRDGGPAETVWEGRGILLEAPEWIERTLVLNGDGALWKLDLDAPQHLARVRTAGLPPVNNDHVIAPDGASIYASADGGHVYRVPFEGGTAQRITTESRRHFLHGVSPDGRTLAVVGVVSRGGDPWGRADLFAVPVDGGPSRRLTPDGIRWDGCEYSPDGAWLYANTESLTPGRAQIVRLRPDGSGLERLTHDERVNWFPHPSPDGSAVLYLSYPAGTQGHPADLDVELRLVEQDRWDAPLTLYRLRGGQGTTNVNGWSPDGERFAFVDYPTD